MASHTSALERIIQPRQGTLSAELAQHLLSLDFSPEDHARYAELSAKAQEGTLTEEEAAEYDDLLAATDVLTIFRSKARVSLKRQTPAA